MRIVLFLLALSSFVGAAEMECIKMKDGRVFTGIYDEEAGTIEITTGTAKAKVALRAEEIATREPIAAKSPARDFIAEAQKLHDQEVTAETAKRAAQEEFEREAARQKIQREKQAADAAAVAQRQLERDDRIRQIKLEGAEAERRASVAVALHDAEEAERQRKRKVIADQQLAADDAERDRLRTIVAKSEFIRAMEERAAKDRMQQNQAQAEELHRQAEANRQDQKALTAIIVLGVGGIIVLLMWLLPALIAHRRRFAKRQDVNILLGSTLVATVLCCVFAGFPINIIGCCIGAIGWLCSLMWVLIASAPPKADD